MFDVTIPGGAVRIMTADEVPVGRRRPVALAVFAFGADRLREVVLAPTGDVDTLARTIGLTASELRALEDLSDLALCMVLKSWTVPDELPTSPGALRALSPDLFVALRDAAVGQAAELVKAVV